ncbi:hypothetical protein EH230_08135 [Flavobacterium columnare]|uniref:PA14 domain-containing protein n=1 Tax=Flavobacterium columnare TaxID=996 RepID=A0A437UB48_9FLAO|nr:hypothetical protein [Flavobacterium columnare]RVU90874.1 hypothetical protein EH230_08135 [Flavobacterium columnare]
MRKIRESHFSKIVAYYLLVNLIVELIAPTAAYALTSGPKQPEFTSFTPIATSDMVDLSSGDFNYNIPIMDVGGYPINLAYNSGVTMDQEASWVGLGWNLNVGQIERQVRGLPDDFNGDLMNYQNDMRENKTIGANFNVSPALLGNNFPFSMGLGVDYNNYVGLSFKPSIGMSFKMGMDSSVGFTLSGSTEGGANLGLDAKYKSRNEKTTANISANLSSRQGLQNISASCFNSDMMLKGGGNFAVFARNTLNRNGYGTASLSLNNTHNYTPTKRVSYINNNKTYNATIGGEVIGIEGELRISGYGSFQNIHEKDKTVSGFGYDNTHLKGNREGVLDFNRENETTINKNSTVLPLTNYTYDTFSIQGQGISGMFRPHHTQVGYLFNDVTIDQSSSQSFGIEIGSGQTVHIGVDFQNSPTESVTGPWYTHNHALGRFTEYGKMGLLQNVSYRMVGELGVDTDKNYINGFEGSSPMKLGISGEWGNRKLESRYDVKKLDYYKYSTSVNNNPISRAKRELKNQVVQKIQNNKADGKFIFKNNAPGHHTAGIKIIKTDGSSYIYGKAAYNNTKIEASFDVSGLNGNVVDSDKELVTYTDSRNSGNSDSDHFYNKTTTPKYAHSYLITSVLSPDYQDIDNNGPSDMDLGNYTKFEYSVPKTYNWRVPTQIKTASYSAGVKSNPNDQKGHYLYGSKELVYLNKIVTKTHIAVFELKDRKDALGVTGEDGGADTSQRMKYISKIMLYAKEDYLKNGSNALPIKTAHFEYDYSLCPNVPSNSGEDEIINTININKAKGKLTLKKIYFTYRNSLMGKYTPYAFEYANNEAYNMKSFDVWNNFKDKSVNPSGISNTEYPYVFQDKATADKNTSTWMLKRIKLPSGGEINIETESDDYKYVQNKKAMQMFQISGVGYTNSPTEDQILYDMLGKGHIKYIYVKIPNANLSAVEFRKKYLSENLSEPIFFNAHVDLVNGDYEPIKGYFLINTDKLNEMTVNSNGIVAIPLRSVKRDGGIAGSSHVNPISKTAWGFGRQNINRRMYQMEGDATTKSFIAACKELVNSIAMMAEIISGPNGMLEMKGRANKIDTSKSWVRLENPSGVKFGGGLRVKSIQLSDNWDVMNSEIDNPIYKEMYGQNYSYSLNDGTSSSGVATFEPNGSQENPFKKPFYSYEDQSYADRISQPAENNYVELPFGESFFPSPKVTYSRVTVANLAKQDSSVPNKVVKKHATGQVVSCFYTSLDFPTKTDFTNIDPWVDTTEDSLLSAFLPKIYSYNSLTFSQGFSVETNDMDGKPKSTSVYAEGVTNDQNFISKEEYIYSLDSNYGLNNDVTTIDENGNVSTNTIGVTRDLVNDFNESQSITKTFGTHVNLAIFIIGIFPITISMPIPNMQYQKNRMRTATTTKVTHRMGLLSEKIVYDNNSKVSTKNLAWDAKTGEVLLTQTSNEFEDNYYSFNYPAYWYYASMGLASENIDFECSLTKSSSSNKFVILNPGQQNITQIFKIGDELQLNDFTKYWVIKVASDGIQLMDKDGNDLDPKITGNFNVRIVNSGNKNLQSSNMATVTAMINPLDKLIGGKIINPFSYLPTDTNKPKVINASAIEYSDDWKSQCENNLPNEFGLLNGQGKPVNPYLYNIKGQWKPIRSYAYLSSRINQEESNRRNKGHFKDYNAFYKIDNVTGKWLMDKQNWTFASAITKYNPYGVEVENKDALNRYSAAQYGYHYKLPVAVGSNTKYQEIGADNFEDYYDDLNPTIYRPHFNFSQGLINNTIFVTDKKSHSGVKSLVVKPGNRATYKRKIEPCKNN